MRQDPREKKKIREPEKPEKKPSTKEAGGEKKITNAPEDRPGYTETSQEKPDNPKPL